MSLEDGGRDRDIKVGSRVVVGPTQLRGVVKFLGTTEFAPTGEWIGVELDEPNGKNDGSVNGNKYFECPMPHGLFCRLSFPVVLEENAGPKAKRSSSKEKQMPLSALTQKSASNLKRRSSRKTSTGARQGAAVTFEVPSSPSPQEDSKLHFEGMWKNQGGESMRISNGQLGGTGFTSFEIVNEYECRLVINGSEYVGRMSLRGEIRWSDGDIWKKDEERSIAHPPDSIIPSDGDMWKKNREGDEERSTVHPPDSIIPSDGDMRKKNKEGGATGYPRDGMMPSDGDMWKKDSGSDEQRSTAHPPDGMMPSVSVKNEAERNEQPCISNEEFNFARHSEKLNRLMKDILRSSAEGTDLLRKGREEYRKAFELMEASRSSRLGASKVPSSPSETTADANEMK